MCQIEVGGQRVEARRRRVVKGKRLGKGERVGVGWKKNKLKLIL